LRQVGHLLKQSCHCYAEGTSALVTVHCTFVEVDTPHCKGCEGNQQHRCHTAEGSKLCC